MVITYHGKQFFKLQLGDVVIACNPVSKDAKVASGKLTKFGADVCLITTNLPEYNGAEQVSFGGKDPFIVKGPGEYEVKGIFIRGILSEATIKGKQVVNTIYTLTLDNIKIAFLGCLTSDLSADAKEAIDSVDVLFVPLSGSYELLTPQKAQSFVVSLEPKIVIPMDYDEKSLPLFFKESGKTSVEAIEKLTIKKKDVESKDEEIVILEEI